MYARLANNWVRRKPDSGTSLDYSHPILSRIMGIWLLNEQGGSHGGGAGSGRVLDSTGRNNGDITQAVYRAGYFGSGMFYDGTSDYVDIQNPANALLDTPGNQLTMLVWARGAAQTTFRYLFGKTNSNSGLTGYNFYTGATSTLYFWVGTGVLNITTDFGFSWDDKWHQIVGVYNDPNLKVYIDGVEKVSVNGVGGAIASSSSRNLRFGDFAEGGGLGWAGYQDHVMLWNRALKQSEIYELYRNPFCMFRPFGRVGYDQAAVVGGGRIFRLAGRGGGLVGAMKGLS